MVDAIRQRLIDVFHPSQLEVIDESHLHIGHAGAQSGKGHYAVVIIADAFVGKAPIERHRMVYDAMGEWMETKIHALSIKASAK